MKKQIDALLIAVREARAFVVPAELQGAGQLLAVIERQKEIDALAVLTGWANDASLSDDDREAAQQALRDISE